MFVKFLSNHEIALLEKRFSQEEILQTLKQIKGRKSPGPDGLQLVSYKNTRQSLAKR